MYIKKKRQKKERNRKDINGQRNIENVYKWRMKEAEEDGEEEEVRTRWRKRERRLEGSRDDVEKRKAGKRSRSVKEDEEKRRRNDDGVGTEGRMKKERGDRG